jgi:hypothetical protein
LGPLPHFFGQVLVTKVGKQGLSMGTPRFRTTERVDLEAHEIANPQCLQKARGEQDEFGIHIRPLWTNDLGTNLVKLAIATLLGSFMTKHGASIPESLLMAKPVMLQTGPNQNGRPFGSQRQPISLSVLEAIHFLGNDIRPFAYSP